MKVFELKEWLESYKDDDTVWIADFEYASFYELNEEYIEASEEQPAWSKDYL